MADLETVNKLRKLNGQEPLTELPGTSKEGEGKDTGGESGETSEQKEARLAAEKTASFQKEGEDGDKDEEIADDVLLKLLNKRGISAATLDDLKKKEEPADPVKAAEKREADELAYGLSEGLFKKAEYDAFVSDTRDLQNFVYADYYNEAKSEDSELTDDEIQEEFLSKYGLDAEKDSRKYKRGVKELKIAANALLKEKHGKILDAKSSFSTHESDAKTAVERNQKITTALPMYKRDIEDIFNSMAKIPVKFSDTEGYEVAGMQEYLDKLKDTVLKPEYFGDRLVKGYEKEVLKQQIWAAFISEKWLDLTKEVTKQHLQNHAAGARGITLENQKKAADAGELTEAQKKVVALYQQAKTSAN